MTSMSRRHGTHCISLDVEGNPWHCGCDLLALATWTTLRKDAVSGLPNCSSPNYVEEVPLRRWFLNESATKCGSATSSLRTDLNRMLSVARSIAKKGPSFFSTLLPVSDDEVNFTATNYFLYAMTARADADIESVVCHWARFLEKVLARRHFRHVGLLTKDGINLFVLDLTGLPRCKRDRENPFSFQFYFRTDPLATTTAKPPATTPAGYLLRPKGFEPLVNFTYVMKNVPENLTKVVDDGIEEELKILFGVINGTNGASLSTTSDTAAVLDFTGLKKMNATEQLVAGLRSELREVLATLLLAIDRAKWDAAEQDFTKEEEQKAQKPPQKPAVPISPMYTRIWRVSAGSHVLMQPQLTLVITVLTLLAHTLA